MVDESNDTFHFKRYRHADTLLSAFNQYRLSSCYTDFNIIVEETTVPCHKAVLASLIPYFHSMFSSKLSEASSNSVTMHGEMTLLTLTTILDFSYTGEILLTRDNVTTVLEAASFFQIEPLRNACCKYLTKLLDFDNCIGVYLLSEKFQCSQLQESAYRFMLHHFSVVSQGEEFLELNAATLEEILSEDKLRSETEEQVFEAVLRWVRHDLAGRQTSLYNVLKCVRFGLMSREQLLSLSGPALRPIIEQITSKSYGLRHPSNQPRDPQRLLRRIYVAGGISADVHSALSEMECYNPDTDMWERMTDLTFPRFGAALLSRKGSLYMVGGHTGSGYIGTVEKFDFEGNCWVPLPGLHGPSRRYFSAVSVDGKIMIMGGCDSSSFMDTAAVLDISSKQLIHAGKLNEQRVYSASCVLSDVVYVVGGYGLCQQYTRLKTAERYDQLTGLWQPLASMNTARSGLGLVAMAGKIYAIGGFDGKNCLNSVEEYHPGLNEWRTLAPMKHARQAHGTAAINGYVYVFGGSDGSKFVSSVERFDPYLGVWEDMRDMPKGKAYFGTTVL